MGQRAREMERERQRQKEGGNRKAPCKRKQREGEERDTLESKTERKEAQDVEEERMRDH